MDASSSISSVLSSLKTAGPAFDVIGKVFSIYSSLITTQKYQEILDELKKLDDELQEVQRDLEYLKNEARYEQQLNNIDQATSTIKTFVADMSTVTGSAYYKDILDQGTGSRFANDPITSALTKIDGIVQGSDQEDSLLKNYAAMRATDESRTQSVFNLTWAQFSSLVAIQVKGFAVLAHARYLWCQDNNQVASPEAIDTWVQANVKDHCDLHRQTLVCDRITRGNPDYFSVQLPGRLGGDRGSTYDYFDNVDTQIPNEDYQSDRPQAIQGVWAGEVVAPAGTVVVGVSLRPCTNPSGPPPSHDDKRIWARAWAPRIWYATYDPETGKVDETSLAHLDYQPSSWQDLVVVAEECKYLDNTVTTCSPGLLVTGVRFAKSPIYDNRLAFEAQQTYPWDVAGRQYSSWTFSHGNDSSYFGTPRYVDFEDVKPDPLSPLTGVGWWLRGNRASLQVEARFEAHRRGARLMGSAGDSGGEAILSSGDYLVTSLGGTDLRLLLNQDSGRLEFLKDLAVQKEFPPGDGSIGDVSKLYMQPDGNLVGYDGEGRMLWASNTAQGTGEQPDFYLAMTESGFEILKSVQNSGGPFLPSTEKTIWSV